MKSSKPPEKLGSEQEGIFALAEALEHALFTRDFTSSEATFQKLQNAIEREFARTGNQDIFWKIFEKLQYIIDVLQKERDRLNRDLVQLNAGIRLTIRYMENQEDS